MKPSEETEPYGEAASFDHHLRISQLVPQKAWAMALVAVGMLGSVALVLWAFASVAEPEGARVPGHLVAFDLTSSSSLASWITTMSLAAAAVVSVMIYSVRRHKTDDYQGRYRLWLWTAAATGLMSVMVVAPLHKTAAALLASLTGQLAAAEGALWWILPAGLVALGLGLRLFAEMRRCKTTMLFISIALVAYGVSIALQFSSLLTLAPVETLLVAAGAPLLGHVALTLGIVGYARFVLRDVQGLVPPPKVKEKVEQPVDEAADVEDEDEIPVVSKASRTSKRTTTAASYSDYDDEDEEEEADDNWSQPRSKRPRKKAPKTNRKVRFDDAEENDAPQPRRMTKAERKRLRKLKAAQNSR